MSEYAVLLVFAVIGALGAVASSVTIWLGQRRAPGSESTVSFRVGGSVVRLRGTTKQELLRGLEEARATIEATAGEPGPPAPSPAPAAEASRSQRFGFDRRLAPATASRRRAGASATTISADGSVEIRLTSVSRREVELAVSAASLTGRLALVRVETEVGPQDYLVPLGPAEDASSILIATSAPLIYLDRNITTIDPAGLSEVPPGQIARSARAAARAGRRWWQARLAAAESGDTELTPEVITAIRQALAGPGRWE